MKIHKTINSKIKEYLTNKENEWHTVLLDRNNQTIHIFPNISPENIEGAIQCTGRALLDFSECATFIKHP